MVVFNVWEKEGAANFGSGNFEDAVFVSVWIGNYKGWLDVGWMFFG